MKGMNTPAPTSLGMLELISHASPLAQGVLALLLLMSILCWAIIFAKARHLSAAKKDNLKFLNVFWNGKNIDEIYLKIEMFEYSPIAKVFKSGVKELKKVAAADGGSLDDHAIANVSRALLRSSTTEVAQLEKYVSWLATTASAAPFIGLFGTVWGIMNSFQGIGASGNANLAVVAPGISEALIATAAGIGAAIPAVMAYNAFANQIKRVAVDMDCFSQDFLNIVQRGASASKKGS
jgi:biopolymer transport protein TolQ